MSSDAGARAPGQEEGKPKPHHHEDTAGQEGGHDGEPATGQQGGDLLAPRPPLRTFTAAQPYEAILKSTAYQRLRAEHPAEFVPAGVFFTHDAASALDRRDSFRVKAALVYEAVTGQHDHDRMQHANGLLLALANRCHSSLQGRGRPDDGGGSPPPAAADPTATDEGWDASKKRVVDAIFLVVGFLPTLRDAIATSSDRDGVDSSFRSHLMHDIVTDVIKLENQIPLQDLLAVADHVEAAVKDAVAAFPDVKRSMKGEYKLPVTDRNLGDVIRDFCWYYSPFATKKSAAPPPPKVTDNDNRTLLDFLHASVTTTAARGGADIAIGRSSRMPSARELRRSGVRLQAMENGRAEVVFVQPAVRLPALVYDFKLATVARNLLAREHEEHSKPVTRYFQMMNEMVEDVADARILRRAGVVRGGSRGAKEVHDLIKNIDGYATYPSVFVAMDREIDKVRRYHGQRMANFFVRNRPGVIWASSVAAISVVAVVAARRSRG